jgi:WD40 repeat protein
MALDCLGDRGRVGEEGEGEEGGPSMLSGNTVMFRVLRQSKVHVVSVHASADGLYLAAASSSDKGVRVWDSGSGRLVQSLHLDDAPAVVLLSPPRGALILTAGQEGMLCLWARQSGQLRRAVATGHAGGVTCAAGDGAWGVVVTGGAEGEVRVWRGLLEEEQGEELLGSGVNCVLLRERHVGGVASVAVTPDGARALSGGADARVRLWDVGRGQLLRRIHVQGAAPGDGNVQVSRPVFTLIVTICSLHRGRVHLYMPVLPSYKKDHKPYVINNIASRASVWT